MNAKLQAAIEGLVQIRKHHIRMTFRDDVERQEAERRWMLEAIEVLLHSAAETHKSP